MSDNHTIRISDRCDTIISRYSLLQHPFYRAWSAGTLPVAALKEYAGEYGAFIRTIGTGWEAVGESQIADIEDGHARIWEESFAANLGTSVSSPQIPEVAALTALTSELFREQVTALGALYAFEQQQPFTAQSKLDGLREHYRALPAGTQQYFRLHKDDFDEPALLADKMNALDSADQGRATRACEQMSEALYNALSGIYAPYVSAM